MAQSKGPGPRAGHCVVEHNNVLYFLGGTPVVSPSYASFTSLNIPLSGLTSIDPESFSWTDLPNPPVPVQITNLTMTFNSQQPTATPSWIDCFATDDGRIIVVGGSFQVLVYNIGSNAWDPNPVSTFKYGPLVTSGMFQNPVYLQSRILADGFTALIVCTLTWNSQPQPYYLDTNTWAVTLAIGTPETTPVASGRSNGWGAIPGVTTLAPPAGLRHFSLAIMGQDKDQPKKNYGNGRAYILGGYSTLVTGQVQDWAVVTSFPVQQAPSNGTLPKVTRGSVAYPVSPSSIAFLPGNGGANGNHQQVQQYDLAQNSATVIDVSGGPKNTIFRGAALIGQGPQIFVHGGLTTLEIGAQPMSTFLDQSVGVYNGESRIWEDTVAKYTAPKSKGLMIGLIVGGVVLIILIGVGIWIFKRRQRIRRSEEEERKAKGMALKNEDMLHRNKDTGTKMTHIMEVNKHGGHEGGFFEPLQPPHQHFGGEPFTPEREGSVDWQRSSTNVNDEIVPVHQYSPQLSQVSDNTRVVHNPQEYTLPPSPSPIQYQQVVNPAGQYTYGSQAYSATQPLYVPALPEDDPAAVVGRQHAAFAGSNPATSAADPSRMSQEAYYGVARPYSSISSLSNQQPGATPYMSSPSYTATTYSMQESGADPSVHRPLLGSDSSPSNDVYGYHQYQPQQ
ncbi:hypothetical protein BG004_000439 [Podila humilis]|nr:hypothetical protein BG004_000439 [Podila humilis]